MTLAVLGRAALPILCCLCCLAIGAAAGSPSPHAQAGPWQILSVGEAGSHRQDYCAAEAEFDGGFTLTIERGHAGQTVIVLQTQAPSFIAKAAYDVRIVVAPGFATKAAGHASDAKTLALSLGMNANFPAALARGQSLSLGLRDEIHHFLLADVKTAMADLERCFANGAPGRVPSAETIVERVLDLTVGGPIQLSYPAGSRADEDRDYAWNEGPVAGGARETEVGPGATFLDLVLTRLDRLISRCRGRFSPELDTPIETTGAVIETGIGTCQGAGADSLVALLYLKAGGRFAEFVLEGPAGARTAAIAGRDHIAKIVRTLIPIR